MGTLFKDIYTSQAPLFLILMIFMSQATAGFDAGKEAYDQKDYKTAWGEFFQSVEDEEDGYEHSLVYLADLYEHGKGVKRDIQLAAELYREAALRGNKYAEQRLEALLEKDNTVVVEDERNLGEWILSDEFWTYLTNGMLGMFIVVGLLFWIFYGESSDDRKIRKDKEKEEEQKRIKREQKERTESTKKSKREQKQVEKERLKIGDDNIETTREKECISSDIGIKYGLSVGDIKLGFRELVSEGDLLSAGFTRVGSVKKAFISVDSDYPLYKCVNCWVTMFGHVNVDLPISKAAQELIDIIDVGDGGVTIFPSLNDAEYWFNTVVYLQYASGRIHNITIQQNGNARAAGALFIELKRIMDKLYGSYLLSSDYKGVVWKVGDDCLLIELNNNNKNIHIRIGSYRFFKKYIGNYLDEASARVIEDPAGVFKGSKSDDDTFDDYLEEPDFEKYMDVLRVSSPITLAEVQMACRREKAKYETGSSEWKEVDEACRYLKEYL